MSSDWSCCFHFYLLKGTEPNTGRKDFFQMQVRSKSFLWSRLLYLSESIIWLLPPHCPYLLKVLFHSLHSRHTDHTAVSQKYHSFSNMPFFLPGMFIFEISHFMKVFFSIVSFPYHSQKPPHIPFPSLLSIPSPYFPPLQEIIYYLTFFHRCIHSFISLPSLGM